MVGKKETKGEKEDQKRLQNAKEGLKILHGMCIMFAAFPWMAKREYACRSCSFLHAFW